MKLFIASDIHGSAYYCRKMLEKFDESGAERLVLLGDILYHGPRNDLPRDYAPKEVISMLNPLSGKIIAVRGNCDWSSMLPPTEVAQVGGKRLFVTHGHLYQAKFTIYNMICAAREEKADILLYGHTHCAMNEYDDGLYIMNPGSCHGYGATYGYIDITEKGDIVTNIVTIK
jgi:putative phosphoesterase